MSSITNRADLVGNRGGGPRLGGVLGGLAALVLVIALVGGFGWPIVRDALWDTSAATDTGPSRILETGPSGLPLPRFVSLKSSPANVRSGPGRDHAIAWQFLRSDWPVEIIAEFDNWRRIRDADGAEGWVFHALLSGRRTAIIAPWAAGRTVTLLQAASAASPAAAHLESGVLVEVLTCDGTWCAVRVERRRGFVDQTRLWGVYPDERID